MEFKKLPLNSKKLLDELLQADNPTEMLCKRFENLTYKEDEVLRGIIKELRENGYINVSWANNVPYHVTINNSARTYNEMLAEYEAEKTVQSPIYIIHDQGVKIGDGNTIRKSTIVGTIQNNSAAPTTERKKGFAERHPILLSVLTGLATGFILLFSFWEKIVTWIEGLF